MAEPLNRSRPVSIENVHLLVHDKTILKSLDFWLLYFISFFQIFYGYYIINIYKSLGASKIRNDYLLTLIGSTASLLNGLSRIVWSTLLDFFTFNQVYRVLLAIQILMIVSLEWSLSKSAYLYFANVCISMICEGAITSILPTETISHFGEVRGP